ncbi:MAG: hypothetical protein U0791_16695 [Gemmataceae bacterium]
MSDQNTVRLPMSLWRNTAPNTSPPALRGRGRRADASSISTAGEGRYGATPKLPSPGVETAIRGFVSDLFPAKPGERWDSGFPQEIQSSRGSVTSNIDKREPMKTLHDRTVDAIFSALKPVVATTPELLLLKDVHWTPLEGFPDNVERIDVMVIAVEPGVDRKWDRWATIRPDVSVMTVIDVVDERTIESNLIERQNFILQSSAYEHLIYDPTAEIMRPSLQGFRRGEEGLDRLASCLHGVFFSEAGFRLDFTSRGITCRGIDSSKEEERFLSKARLRR